ncbi:MAG: Zn-ribbon domain-containing OB-fold protein [Acidimicrobiales bacterium]
MAEQIPLVDYLVLGDDPHLVARECAGCGARFFDRRNACAGCGGTEFSAVRVASEGEVRAFTIVSLAAPGIPVPFVASLVDCEGTSVRANVVNVEPSPERVSLGMKVRLVTVPVGVDGRGTEAVGFGFEPVDAPTVSEGGR